MNVKLLWGELECINFTVYLIFLSPGYGSRICWMKLISNNSTKSNCVDNLFLSNSFRYFAYKRLCPGPPPWYVYYKEVQHYPQFFYNRMCAGEGWVLFSYASSKKSGCLVKYYKAVSSHGVDLFPSWSGDLSSYFIRSIVCLQYEYVKIVLFTKFQDEQTDKCVHMWNVDLFLPNWI